MPVRNLGTLTLIVTILVAIDAALIPLILLGYMVMPEATQTLLAPFGAGLDFALLGFTLFTSIIFARWIYVAGRNLEAAGYEDLEFSPGARIWWFFVPIACLFKPYQGMRELWETSHGEADGNGLVGVWWALWIITGFVGYLARAISASPDAGTGPLWLESAVGGALAVVAIMMLRSIADAQTRLTEPALAEVFA